MIVTMQDNSSINEGEGEGETGGGCDDENSCCIGGWCDNKIMMLIKMMREIKW